MIPTVLIDDDEKNISVLKALLQKTAPHVQVIGEAGSATKGFDVITRTRPELVFLDIEMPYGNAFDLLDKLMPVDFAVIFVTAFNEYSLKAFRYSALDYLLKPVDLVELGEAVNKATTSMEYKSLNRKLEYLISGAQVAQPRNIALPTREGYDFINICDIIRCEAQNNCTTVFTKPIRKYVCSRTLKEYEELLPPERFFRIHHAHLVNTDHIKKYHKEGRSGYVELQDGTTLEVASRRKDQFLKLFKCR